MKVVLVGGKLQGVEAAYLAHQAGWEVILVDKDDLVPASGMCDEFYKLDVIEDQETLARVIESAGLIIPATENEHVIKALQGAASKNGIPLAFDSEAYKISSSKIESDKLFEKINIPAPRYWPHSNFPVIVKPSGSSGSKDVRKISSSADLSAFLREKSGEMGNWVIQEFVEGPSYSLEVMGHGGKYITLQTTDLEMDRQYDCSRVLAPTELSMGLEKELRELSVKIAKAIKLTGIMDVEVINHNGTLQVLEIDARLPSQTPTAVFKSTGINMLNNLQDIFVRGTLPPQHDLKGGRAVIYEHILVSDTEIRNLGEHIMTTAGPLKHCQDFFGADEAITSFKHGSTSWVATLIITGSDRNEALSKHSEVIKNINSNI